MMSPRQRLAMQNSGQKEQKISRNHTGADPYYNYQNVQQPLQSDRRSSVERSNISGIGSTAERNKAYAVLPELRAKKEIKIEPFIYSRSNNAWKAITPFK